MGLDLVGRGTPGRDPYHRSGVYKGGNRRGGLSQRPALPASVQKKKAGVKTPAFSVRV